MCSAPISRGVLQAHCTIANSRHRDDGDAALLEAVEVRQRVFDRSQLRENRAIEAAGDVHFDIVDEGDRPAAVHLVLVIEVLLDVEDFDHDRCDANHSLVHYVVHVFYLFIKTSFQQKHIPAPWSQVTQPRFDPPAITKRAGVCHVRHLLGRFFTC